MTLRERRVNAGRLSLHLIEAGAGPAVLFLHGFPAYSADWTEQLHALSRAGFRAIAPDLPGYGRSEQLSHVRDYRASALADDLAGLIRGLGLPRVHVVGHDWGGTLAYCLAAQHPELVARLVVLNAPHPELYRSALRHLAQLGRSWYVALFQLPWLPEWLLQQRSVLRFALRGMAVRPEAFSDADLERYLHAMRIPGVPRAALAYYRAAFRAPLRLRQLVPQRTLVLWGEQDAALSGPLLLAGLEAYVPRLQVQRFADAGHWLHHDAPQAVNRLLLEFLAADADG